MKDTAVLDDIKTDEKTESDLNKVVKILLDDNYKRRKTILSNRQVSPITVLDVLAQIYEVEFLKVFCDNYSEWRTSGDGGKGRQDIVEITKYSIERENQRQRDILEAMGRR